MPPLPHELQLIEAESRIRFVVIQDGTLAVPGTLRPSAGSLDSSHWSAWIELPLATIDTGEPERDAQIRKHFFEVDRFPTARVVVTAAGVPPETPETDRALEIGETRDLAVRVDLELRGGRYPIEAELRVSREATARVRVTTRAPILLLERSAGLRPQFTLLELVAGVDSLARVVPLEVDLVFQEAAP